MRRYGVRGTKHTVRLGRVSPELKLWDSGAAKSEPRDWARETYDLFRTAKWVLPGLCDVVRAGAGAERRVE